MDYIAELIALGSIILAIIAWIAKLRWSKEFVAAKNVQIEALRQQVKALEDTTRYLKLSAFMKFLILDMSEGKRIT